MPKYEKWMKSPEWLTLVRTLPCMNCNRWPVDAHHVDARGMGLKNPDSMCIPLCRSCHMDHHDSNLPSKDKCREYLAQFWASMAEFLLLGPGEVDGRYNRVQFADWIWKHLRDRA